MEKRYLVSFALFIFISSLAQVSAEDYALDIQIEKSIYNSGENVTYEVVLLNNGIPYSDNIKIFISDVSNKEYLDFDVQSNTENSFFIENNFPSGYWKIEASYDDKNVKRFFTIGEREEAEFSIEGDKLIIKNSESIVKIMT